MSRLCYYGILYLFRPRRFIIPRITRSFRNIIPLALFSLYAHLHLWSLPPQQPSLTLAAYHACQSPSSTRLLS